MALCNFWTCAGDAFRALASAWQCQCERHDTNLVLKHRTTAEEHFQVTFMIPSLTQWNIHRVNILSHNDERTHADGSTRLQRPAATSSTNSAQQPSPPESRESPSPSPNRFSIRRKPVSSTAVANIELGLVSQTPPVQRIFDLCEKICGSQSSYYGFILDNECKYSVFPSERPRMSTSASITLRQVLEARTEYRLTRRQLYTVSFILASSFLQLFESPWLQSLEKDEVHFLGDISSLTLDEPLLKRYFSTHTTEQMDTSDPSDEAGVRNSALGSADALDQLGILLLELCFGRPLETHPYRKEWPAGADARQKAAFDHMAARSWQEDILEEAGPEYAEAVRWCLWGNRETPSDRWRLTMLQKVVQPLQRCQIYLSS